MITRPLNILEELQKERNKFDPETLLREARNILSENERTEQNILDRLAGSENIDSSFTISPENPNLYYIPTIKNICIRYRLRFLRSALFKNQFPREAILAIKKFEEEQGKKVASFRIIAPAEAFNLEDRDKDPLLFADLGGGAYYLLHKWGSDLSFWRKILFYPVRDIFTLIKSVFCLSILVTLIIPTDWVIRYENDPEKILYYKLGFLIWSFVAVFFTIVYLGLTFRKGLSVTEWKSRYFN